MISAEVKSTQVLANLKRANDVVKVGTPKALLDVGFEVMRLSQLEVPHDKGTLQNSGTVETIDGGVVVGYHEPYAARLHEHPEYHFQGGRKGKYLEDPIRRNQEVLGIKFNDSFGTGLEEALQ